VGRRSPPCRSRVPLLRNRTVIDLLGGSEVGGECYGSKIVEAPGFAGGFQRCGRRSTKLSSAPSTCSHASQRAKCPRRRDRMSARQTAAEARHHVAPDEEKEHHNLDIGPHVGALLEIASATLDASTAQTSSTSTMAIPPSPQQTPRRVGNRSAIRAASGSGDR
jgi:hypothetical protein